MLYDNTTVQGSWVNIHNMTKDSAKYGRIVNNVSMAMPLSALSAAARDPRSKILQPQEPNVGADCPTNDWIC